MATSSLCALFLTITTTMAMAQPELLFAPAGQSSPSTNQPEVSISKLSFFTPPGQQILPKISKCWMSIVNVKGCVADLRSSFARSCVKVSRDCCEAVVAIGEECFIAIFTNFPFGPLFAPLLKGFCEAFVEGGICHKNQISPSPV